MEIMRLLTLKSEIVEKYLESRLADALASFDYLDYLQVCKLLLSGEERDIKRNLD